MPRCARVCVFGSAESKAGDRGKIARASGDYGIVNSHDLEKATIRIRLPSGSKNTLQSTCRASSLVVAALTSLCTLGNLPKSLEKYAEDNDLAPEVLPVVLSMSAPFFPQERQR